jgi:hypothetical protein
MTSNDQRLDKIIAQFDQGKLPSAKSSDEAVYLRLIKDLKVASKVNLDSDPGFVDELERKLTEGGEIKMKTFWKDLFSWPVVAGALVVFAVVTVAIPGGVVPTPTGVLRSLSLEKPLGVGGEGVTSNLDETISAEKGMAPSSAIQIQPYPLPEAEIMPPTFPVPFPGGEDLTSPERFIVRSASLSLEVKDVSSAVGNSANYVTSVGGLVTNSSVTKTDRGYMGYMTARVPEEKLATALEYFKGLAVSVEEEQVSAYDETGQVTSAQEQIQDLEDQLARYQELLRQATDTQERLRIQQQIDRLEQQIKSWQKQEGSLKGQAAMSQVNLTFTEKRFTLPLLKEIGMENVVQEAIWALKKVALSLVVLAVWVVIFTPIWLPLVLVVRWLKRKK